MNDGMQALPVCLAILFPSVHATQSRSNGSPNLGLTRLAKAPTTGGEV
jgi:hypothetical protein